MFERTNYRCEFVVDAFDDSKSANVLIVAWCTGIFTVQSTIAAIDQEIHKAGTDHPRTPRPGVGAHGGERVPSLGDRVPYGSERLYVGVKHYTDKGA